MRKPLLAVFFVACGSASNPVIDAMPRDAASDAASDATAVDAAMPDASATLVTLDQNASMSVAADTGRYCGLGPTGQPITETLEQSRYRVFATTTLGGALRVTDVEFGIEKAQSPSGAQQVQLRLYAMDGTALTNLNVLSLLRSETVTIADTNVALRRYALATPVAVPAGKSLVVEMFSAGTTNTIFIHGANKAGETAPSYYRAPACGISSPSAPTNITSHWVARVFGQVNN